MKQHAKTPVLTLESWTYEGDHKDGMNFVAAMKLSGKLENTYKIPAKLQRELFGNVPFGRNDVCVDTSGMINVIRKCAFGQDANVYSIAPGKIKSYEPFKLNY